MVSMQRVMEASKWLNRPLEMIRGESGSHNDFGMARAAG
jgi:hypothetical protein